MCERVFLPPKQELQAQLAVGHAAADDRVARHPVRDFDVLAFSVSFEWDYTNVVSMLRLAGIPARADARTQHDPLVVIGGAVTFVNPEPLALFADVIAAGEGEVLVPALMRAHRRRRRSRRPAAAPRRASAASTSRRSTTSATTPTARSRRSSRSPAPARRPVVKKAAVKSTDHARSAVDADLHARHGVRLAVPDRGRARLRQPVPLLLGRLQLPARARVSRRSHPRARARGAAARQPRRPRVDRALRSPGDRAHPAGPDRDGLLDQPGVAAPRRPDRRRSCGMLHQSGERSITIAPETGSDRLRRVINKTVTNAEILEKTDLIFANGIENLKLYYMIGLPTETDDDLERDPRPDRADARHHAGARPPEGPHRPDRRQREPADPEARHRLPVAADGRSGDHRSQGQAAAHRWSPISTTSTSTSSRSGTRTTRRCCRSAIGASRRRSKRPSATAATGAPRSPRPASTPTSTSSATDRTTPCCRGTSSTAA